MERTVLNGRFEGGGSGEKTVGGLGKGAGVERQ